MFTKSAELTEIIELITFNPYNSSVSLRLIEDGNSFRLSTETSNLHATPFACTNQVVAALADEIKAFAQGDHVYLYEIQPEHREQLEHLSGQYDSIRVLAISVSDDMSEPMNWLIVTISDPEDAMLFKMTYHDTDWAEIPLPVRWRA